MKNTIWICIVLFLPFVFNHFLSKYLLKSIKNVLVGLSIRFITLIIIFVVWIILLGSTREIFFNWVNAVDPDTTWISEPTKVFYFDNDALYSIHLNGSHKHKYYDMVHSFKISPNGDKIALKTMKRAGPQVAIVDLSDGHVDLIASKGLGFGLPIWTADGTKIIYQTRVTESTEDIIVYDVQEGIKRAANINRLISVMDTTRDSSKIYWKDLFSKKCYGYNLRTYQSEGVVNCKIMDSDKIYKGVPSGLNRVLDVGFKHNYSPGKQMAAYTREGSLWIEQGSQKIKHVVYPGYYDSKLSRGVANIMWSPDEKYIVFDFNKNIYLLGIATGKIGRLTAGSNAIFYP